MPSPRRHLSVDELTQRASTGLAIRRGTVKISDPIPSSYIHNGAEMDEGAYEHPTPRPEAGTWTGRNNADISHGRSESLIPTPTVHVSRFTERTSLGPSLSASNMSSTPSKDSFKKNNGLRASLRRIFSSKKDRSPVVRQMSHPLADPGRILSMPGPQPREPTHHSQTFTSPITPNRALHSHAPSPLPRVDDMGEFNEESNFGSLGPRRNTVPSLLIVSSEDTAQPDSRQREAPMSPPRPTTAIKRGTPPEPQFNRRSRSADDLAEVLRSPKPPSNRRDRAEEIAFWRNSIVVDPLPDLTSPRPAPTPPVEMVSREETISAAPRPSIEPAQQFDFGLDDPVRDNSPEVLRERVNTLEVKLINFEYALTKLQGTDLDRPDLPKKPARRKSVRNAFPESGSSSAQETSSNELSYPSTPSDHWHPTAHREASRSLIDRTSKATTIKATHRRAPSNRSQISTSIHFTREEYDILYNLIRDEKSARQTLEMQVMNLQKEVDILKTPVYSYVRPASDYPTPSPDSFRDRGSGMLSTPRILHRSPNLRGEPELNLNETSRFSMTETESDAGDEEDSPYPEMYETPQETIFRFDDAQRVSPPGMI